MYRREDGELADTWLAQRFHIDTSSCSGVPTERVDKFYPNNLASIEPAATVCIPYAWHEEDPETTLLPTLHRLQDAAKYAGALHVMVWANVVRPADELFVRGSYEKYESLTKSIKESLETDFGLLQITSVREYMPAPKGFNEIRANYMDALAYEAQKRKLPAAHPVIWLDADTPFMSKTAIRDLVGEIHANEAHFVHANLLPSGDDPDAPPFSERSEAEKVTALYGLTKRMTERKLGPYEPRGYVEESGLGMRLDTYLAAGGVGFTGPEIGESKILLHRAAQRLDPDKPLIKYVDSARIGFSDRRYRMLAETVMPILLPQSEDGADYIDYTKMVGEAGASTASSRDPITAGDIWDMIDFMAARQEKRTGDNRTALTEVQRKRLGRLINRWGFTQAT